MLANPNHEAVVELQLIPHYDERERARITKCVIVDDRIAASKRIIIIMFKW